MCGDGFTDEGLAALDAALARHTSTGAVPGLVALVARGGQVHVTSAAAAYGASGDAGGPPEANTDEVNRGDLVLIDRPDGLVRRTARAPRRRVRPRLDDRGTSGPPPMPRWPSR